MIYSIEPKSPLPIYEQIVTQILFAVARGDLEPGNLIPSIRDLAAQLVVHPNTVARAYQELEQKAILETKRGRGMEVTLEAVSICRVQRREIVRSRIREALREAVASALSADEVHGLVEEEWGHLNGHTSPSES